MSADAARARCYRQRHHNGRAIVMIEIDLEPVTAYLVDAELLQLGEIENREAIAAAIGRLINLLIAAQHLRCHV
jgi:hypothetical protein